MESIALLLWPELPDGKKVGSIDGTFLAPDRTRFRFNLYRRQGQLAIALRHLESSFQTLAQLGLPQSLEKLCDLRDGLVIVTGATGSGKSTTLATLIDMINHNRADHIVTIEDPIEYIHHPQKSLVDQRQVGIDAPSFNDALVASLRQDPDVILIGEIREVETIRTAITAAETGHLVFTTLHAGDCIGAVERFVSVFPADEQESIRRRLSLILRCVVAQHLLPPADENGEDQVRGRRIPACEVMYITNAIANLIAQGKSTMIYSTMEAGMAHGMQTLEHDLARLYVAGKISEHCAVAHAKNAGILNDRIAILRKWAR
jgi:twitching motility protein PilT